MVSGAYDVTTVEIQGTNKSEIGNKKSTGSDNSYRSCLCALLIFIAICLLILLVSIIPWRGKSGSTTIDNRVASSRKGGEEHETYTTKKPVKNVESAFVTRRTYTLKPITRKYLINYFTRMAPNLKEEIFTELSTIPTPKPPLVDTVTAVVANTTEKLLDKLIYENSTEITKNQHMVENSVGTHENPVVPTTDESSTIRSQQYSTSVAPTVTDAIMLENSSPEMAQPVTTETPIQATTGRTNDRIIFLEGESPSLQSTDEPTWKPSTEILKIDSRNVVEISTNIDVNEIKTDQNTSRVNREIIVLETTPASTKNESRRVREKIIIKEIRVIENRTNACNTNVCKSAASKMYTSLNLDVNPCDNFYEFACGNEKISNEQLKRDHIKQIIRNRVYNPKVNNNFKSFYFSCITHDPLALTENLRIMLNLVESRIGIFLNHSYFIENEREHITSVMAELLLQNSPLLFDVDLESNREGIYTFKLIPPRWPDDVDTCTAKCRLICLMLMEGLQPPDLHLSYHKTNCMKNCTIESRIDNMRSILHKLNLDFGNLTNQTKYLEQIISDYGNLFKNTYIPRTIEANYNYEAQKNFVTKSVDDFNRYFYIFDWQMLFEKLASKDVNPNTEVRIYFDNEYFKGLFNYLKSLDVRQIHNILLANFVHNLYMEMIVPTTRTSRDTYCFEQGLKLYPKITTDLYLESLNRTIALTKIESYVREMFDNLKEIFKKSVYKSSEIEEEDKETIVRKLETIQIYFVQSSGRVWRASMGIHQKYLENYFFATRYSRIQRYAVWNETFGTLGSLWFNFESVLDVAPVTVYPTHAIVIPYGMFDNDLTFNMEPSYLAISKSGLKLARHLIDQFNTIGLTFESKLNFEEAYKTDIEECFKEKYNKQQFIMINSKNFTYNINMTYFIDETISDSGAIRLAYDLFSTKTEKLLPWIGENFTRQQLFYISAVQEFCDPEDDDIYRFTTKLYKHGLSLPARPRIQSFLSNDIHFPAIFNCTKGTDLNPSHQCVQFPNFVRPDEIYENIEY